MRLARSALTVLIALAVVATVACGGDDDDASDGSGSLTVVASQTIVADWVEQVGGEHVDVTSLVGQGADVHTFTLSPGDIRTIGDAGAIFLIGESLEAGFEDAVRENAGGPVIALAEGLPLAERPGGEAHAHDEDDHEEDDGHAHGEHDPHIWMSIDLAIMAVERVRDELGAIDPDNADAYAANAEAYVAELDALDAELQEQLNALPENRRYLVTFHDAYGYFADAYGLTILGFIVEGSDEEPSAGRFAELVGEVREHEVPYIFIEPQFSARVVEQLAAETGAEVRVIPSDALSGDYRAYTDLMRGIADGITH